MTYVETSRPGSCSGQFDVTACATATSANCHLPFLREQRGLRSLIGSNEEEIARRLGEAIGRGPVHATLLVHGHGQATAEEPARVGDQAGGRVVLFLCTDNFWRDYHDPQSRSARLAEEPRDGPSGTVAVFFGPTAIGGASPSRGAPTPTRPPRNRGLFLRTELPGENP